MNTFQLSEALVQRLAWTLTHFLWQGFAIALVLAISVRLGRVRRSNWRYGLTLVAFIAMIAAPVATFTIANVAPQVERPPHLRSDSPSPSPFPRVIPDGNKVPRDDAETVLDLDAASATAAERPSDFPTATARQAILSHGPILQRVQPWIVCAWIVGVALLSSRLLVGWIGVWQIRRRGIGAPDWLREQTQQLSVKLHMACPELKVGYRVREAIALGFLRPMILLPAAWVMQMPPDMLEAVLAHELAHIRRHDLWVNLLQRVVETLLFYHPAVWWLSRRLRIERELCCDELVVRVTQNPLRYAETLEHIGRLSLASTQPTLVVSITGSRSILSDRIRNILRLQPQDNPSWAWLAGVIPLLLTGVVYWSVTGKGKVSAATDDDSFDGSSIVAVKFSGNKVTSDADLANHIKTRPGDHVTKGQIKDDVDALVGTRLFSKVEPIIRRTDEGPELTLDVIERPLISSVEYRGNKRISTEILSKLTELKRDQPFNVSTNRECVRRIKERYREQGFPFATVELEQGDLQNDPAHDIIFLIDEGPKVSVTTIEFEDHLRPNTPLPKQIAPSKTKILWLMGEKHAPASAGDESATLREYYHGLGYFDVQIVSQRKYAEDMSTVQFSYRIDEGERYRIGDITITGNSVFTQDQILEMIKVQPGQEYNQRQINKDTDAILANYGSRSRLFAQVHPIRKFPGKPALVNLVFQIDEDKEHRIREVQVSKDNDLAATSEDNKATARVIDKSREDTRLLAFTPIDPKVAMSVRTMTERQKHRQRTEVSGGVLVSIEEAKCRWKMRAKQVLVETDSHDKPATGLQETQLQLQADNFALTTKTSLRMTLIGNVSVAYTLDGNRTPAEVTADKIIIDFERGLLFAEKARFKSNDTIMEGDRVSVSFQDDSLRVGTASEESPQVEAHSIEAVRRLRVVNNDKEAASKLVGDWKLKLPSGTTHDLKLVQREDGCLRFGKNLNVSGAFAYRNKRLELVEPTQNNVFDFIWGLQEDGSFKLIHEQHKVSAKYVGAVLVRSVADSPSNSEHKVPPVDVKKLRSDRMRGNDREAAMNLVGRWLLTLPSHDLIDVELTGSDDGCLRLASRKGSDFIGRYSLNGDRLELVDHESQETDFVWRLEGQNALKLIEERHKGGVANPGAKLERIAADRSQANVFRIPNEFIAQTQELAAAYARKKATLKSRRPAGLEDLESAESIRRAVDRAMQLLADGQKYSDGLVQLRYLGDEAFDALVAGAQSRNTQVAKWSCSALEHRGLKAVGPLSDALKSHPDAAVRSVAASALGQTFQPSAVPALIAALDDPDPQVRVSVLNSIKYPRDARALEPLKRFVDEPGVGHVAANAIQHIQKSQGYVWWPAETLDLCQLCQDAHTLKGENYRDAELKRLIDGLKSDEGTIGYYCLFALGHLGSKESVSAILQGPLSEMKFHTLAEIATPEAIEYLIQRLHSLNPQTRELAIQGLANGADRWAAPLLIALLDDPGLKVEARKMDFAGSSRIGTWPESHRAHSALYSFFSRFGLTGEWRNLYANQTNNVPEEITNLKAWWKQHGGDFVAGKDVPTPNLSTVFYNDP